MTLEMGPFEDLYEAILKGLVTELRIDGELAVIITPYIDRGMLEIQVEPGYEDFIDGLPVRRQGNSNIYTLSAMDILTLGIVSRDSMN